MPEELRDGVIMKYLLIFSPIIVATIFTFSILIYENKLIKAVKNGILVEGIVIRFENKIPIVQININNKTLETKFDGLYVNINIGSCIKGYYNSKLPDLLLYSNQEYYRESTCKLLKVIWPFFLCCDLIIVAMICFFH